MIIFDHFFHLQKKWIMIFWAERIIGLSLKPTCHKQKTNVLGLIVYHLLEKQEKTET